jgi:hypothetical protein
MQQSARPRAQRRGLRASSGFLALLLFSPLTAAQAPAAAQLAPDRTILVLSKDPYTDSDEEDAEITAALVAEFGAGNVTVTDGGDASGATWTGLLAGVDTLVIPEQDGSTIWAPGRTEALRGGETWPITDEAMDVIRAWAEAGGVVMGTGSYSHQRIIEHLTRRTFSVWWNDYPGNYVRGPWDAPWSEWDYGWFSRMAGDASLPDRLPGANWAGGMTVAYTDSANPGGDQAWTSAEREGLTIVYGYQGPYYGDPATQTIEQIGVGVFAVGSGSYIYYAYDWFPDSYDRDTAVADPTHTAWWNLALVLGAGGQISQAAGGGGVPDTKSEAPGGSVPVVQSDGGIPQVPVGVGVWQQTDGSSVPLVQSSPGPNQVRYSADGFQVTFTGGQGTGVSQGLVADPNGEVVCEICAFLAAGGVIEAWMFSEPRLVAAWRIEDLPCQRFTIPVVAPLDGGGPVPAGVHTLQLALPTVNGMQAVNVGVTVGSSSAVPVPNRVNTGGGPVPVMPLSFVLLLAAMVAALVTVDRGREVAAVVAASQRARVRAVQALRLPAFDALDLRIAQLREAVRRSS